MLVRSVSHDDVKYVLPFVPSVAISEGTNGRTYFTSSWLTYRWKDGFEQYFAEDFIYPTQCSVTLLWDLWHFGKVGINEDPYRKDGITDKFLASVMASESVFCTPTNVVETILETSPAVTLLTAPMTCKQFRI